MREVTFSQENDMGKDKKPRGGWSEREAKEWRKRLDEIFENQVFELHWEKGEAGQRNALIPYMMNDAAECYFVLTNCRMAGEYREELAKECSYTLEKGGLIVKQGEENAFTLWFERMELVKRLYQYHGIGHFWVKGQEQWRRAVYILGTIADKYRYLGAEALNPKEMELKDLIFFGPLRYYSPVGEGLEEKYPECREGSLAMERLAAEEKEQGLLRLLALYKRVPCRILSFLLRRRLQSLKSLRLYELLWKKIEEASQAYPERQYGEEMEAAIREMRTKVQKKLREQGFQGEYPRFFMEGKEVVAAEEHPFTVMEAEDYGFRIQFMVSTYRKAEGLNCGFFRGKQRKGRITSKI